MSDEEIIERHDRMTSNVYVGVDYILSELARRQSERQMTLVVRLTVAIAVLTLVNVVLVALTLARTWG